MPCACEWASRIVELTYIFSILERGGFLSREAPVGERSAQQRSENRWARRRSQRES